VANIFDVNLSITMRRIKYIQVSVVALLLGVMVYEIDRQIFFTWSVVRNNISDDTFRLMRNHLPDGLWALSLVSLITYIWYNDTSSRNIWIFFAGSMMILFEGLQYCSIVKGTGDVLDILSYIIFSIPIIIIRYKKNEKQKNLVSLMVIVAFAFLAVASTEDDVSTTGSSSTSSSPSASQSPVAKIGDKVNFSDSEWEVISARELGGVLRGNDFVEAKRSEGKFIYVQFRVTNNTSEAEGILFTPVLQDSRGRKFEELDDLEFYLGENETGIFAEQLPPGLPKRFSAIFEVPSGATGFRFMARNFASFRTQEKGVELGF